MKIKSIILAAVLATTMTGCAVMNQIGEHLEEMGRQARIREELRYPTRADSLEKRLEWFEDIKEMKNPNFCYSHDDCVEKGYGEDRYIYVAGTWNQYGRGIIGYRNNKIAHVGYELTKCYSPKKPKHLQFKNNKKYEKQCDSLVSKIDDMEEVYARQLGNNNEEAGTVIEYELFK